MATDDPKQVRCLYCRQIPREAAFITTECPNVPLADAMVMKVRWGDINFIGGTWVRQYASVGRDIGPENSPRSPIHD